MDEQRKPTRLKILLKKKGMSYRMLADKSDVPILTINNLANGYLENVEVVTANKLCNALRIPFEYLFGDVR